MKRAMSILCAAAMAVSTVGFTSIQANAQRIQAVPAQATEAMPLIEVRNHRRDRGERHHRGERQHFERRGNRAYYRGHRGYRHARPGWREFDGWWFPPAAFALGAILGGTIAQPAPRYRGYRATLPQAHVDWCFSRYRSYRVSDNTFQPYNGPRRQCVSPYA